MARALPYFVLPLLAVEHLNEKDFINLMHDVKRHEEAVMEDAKEIRRLKVDVWELSNLVRLLAALCQGRFLEWWRKRRQSNSKRSYRRYFRNMESRAEHFRVLG
jgi:hypothetical protein